MAKFTLTEATEFYTAAKTAYTDAITGKEYDIKDRSLKRQDLAMLEKVMNKWKKYIDDINAGRDPDNPITIKRGRFIETWQQ